MHLFYCKIAPNVISLLLHTDVHDSKVPYLSDCRAHNVVDRNIVSNGIGIPSVLSKRPQGLDKVNRWKAYEWKFFVLSTSFFCTDGWVPDHFLDIWYIFVRICELRSLCTISEEEVRDLNRLCPRLHDIILKDILNISA